MSIHHEETTSQPRGLTEPISFMAIQAITHLNTHQPILTLPIIRVTQGITLQLQILPTIHLEHLDQRLR